MNPDPGSTPQPTPFFSTDAKNFFSYNLPADTWYFDFLLKFCAKIFICKFQSAHAFMRKGKDPDPYLWLMDPDPIGPKQADHAHPNPVPDPGLHHRREPSRVKKLGFQLHETPADLSLFCGWWQRVAPGSVFPWPPGAKSSSHQTWSSLKHHKTERLILYSATTEARM